MAECAIHDYDAINFGSHVYTEIQWLNTNQGPSWSMWFMFCSLMNLIRKWSPPRSFNDISTVVFHWDVSLHWRIWWPTFCPTILIITTNFQGVYNLLLSYRDEISAALRGFTSLIRSSFHNGELVVCWRVGK